MPAVAALYQHGTPARVVALVLAVIVARPLPHRVGEIALFWRARIVGDVDRLQNLAALPLDIERSE
jgi:hypothetical protein